ncbi:MAG: hypothetical protein U1F83_04955 [Verrucomicrobiota bacterium]
MANTLRIPRAHLALAICLPLAIILGYFLSDPLEPNSLMLVGFVFGGLSIPLLMKWHHPFLIFCWNSALALSFLPGQPDMWTVVAGIGLFFGILNRSVDASKRFLDVPQIRTPLLLLGLVVMVTAYLNGGIGMAALGSDQLGGKRYFYICVAIMGFFALTSQRIPASRANFYVSMFFLSMITGIIPNLAFYAGSKLDFIYYFFSAAYSGEQVNAAVSGGTARIFGLTMVATGLLSYLLARFGIRGIFQPGRIWRMLFLIGAFTACLASGFRSLLILLGLIFIIQFFLEKLHKTNLLWMLVGVTLVGGVIAISQAQRLPFFVQRTLSFLPIDITPEAKLSGTTTLEWRFQMWEALLPEVPPHLLKGKGYAIDRSALYFSGDASRQVNGGFEWAVVSGDYHNGPLSLIIPFGIWGVLAFGWFIWSCLRFLYAKHRNGDPRLQQANTLLFSFFLARLILWTFFVGSFYGDLYIFTGVIGLSISLNGVAAEAPESVVAEDEVADTGYRDDYA